MDEQSKSPDEVLEEFAEEIGEKFEEEFEKRVPKFVEPLFGAVVMFAFMVFVNMFWDRFDFITDDFEKILPSYNVALLVGIVVQLSRMIFHGKGFKIATDFINLIFFFYIAYLFWVIYPFDVEGVWDLVIKILIIVPPFAALLGLIVESTKYLMNCVKPKAKKS